MGHYTCPPVWIFRGSVLKAAIEAENQIGSPVTINDIYRAYLQMNWIKVPYGWIWGTINDLVRNDELLVDEKAGHFSTNAEM